MKKIFSQYFSFKQLNSPTFYNLNQFLIQRGWRSTRFAWLANFGEKNFQFDQSAAEQLEFKHLLAQLVADNCPGMMPETFCINDTNWSWVLSNMAEKYYMKNNTVLDHLDNLI